MAKDALGASSISEVTGKIGGAQTVQACVDLMTTLSVMMQTDAELSGPLETAGMMWNSSADAVNTAHLELHSVTETLLQDWHSEDSEIFKQNRATTEASLSTSYGAMTPAQGLLNELAGQIRTTATTVATQTEALNKVVREYNAAKTMVAPGDFNEAAWANQARIPLQAAGDAMTALAGQYSSTGATLTSNAQRLKWDGPGSRNGSPSANTPGNTPSAPGSPGGPTGADPAAADPGGQQAGPADQGGGAQDAGAGAGGMDGAGEAGGTGAGSIPEVPGGGTGLAGMPAGSTALFPREPMLPNVPVANAPVTSPINTLPVGAVPGGFTGGAAGAGGGVGKVPGGGVGGGGLPGAGGVGGGHQKGVGSRPGAVAETASSQGPLSGGRAPAAPAGLAGGTGAASGQGGGGMPPMMPPMAGAAGAGSNRAGKPGNGVLAGRANRRRDRQQGDTPGVPAGLRGREGKDLPGAFPAVPVNTRRRKEKTEAANTLQFLDEDLWKVEATDAKAAPHQERRPSN
ncbi:hypothetical protein ACWF0M_13800 [Kribbella sp. NPDC055110]